jgi:polynucleotide 5'-hydroxyl-kinase GRC3/NOL9
MNDHIRNEPAWEKLLDDLKTPGPCRLIYVVGAVDHGKTTVCRYLEQGLSDQYQTAYIDCDPGQSVIGPPATIGMRIGAEERKIISFVGSTSPKGHMLQSLSGIMRLTAKAKELGADRIILDSSGFVLDKPAGEYQYNIISAIQPDVLVSIQAGIELEYLLDNFTHSRKSRILRLNISKYVMPRSMADRQTYRMTSFRTYLTQATLQEIPMQDLGIHGIVPDFGDEKSMENLLVGLCDADGFMIALGVVKTSDPQTQTLYVHSRPFDPADVASLQFGSTRLDTRSWKDY